MRPVPIALVAVLVLGACQRAATPTPAVAPAPATAPAAAASADKPAPGFFASMFAGKPALAPADLGDFKIVSVTLGNSVDAEQQVPSARTVFGRHDPIYAAVLSTGRHQGLKFSARWTTADGQLVAQTDQSLVPTSATVTTFSLRDGDPWPVGKYQLVLSVDQQVQSTTPFEIR